MAVEEDQAAVGRALLLTEAEKLLQHVRPCGVQVLPFFLYPGPRPLRVVLEPAPQRMVLGAYVLEVSRVGRRGGQSAAEHSARAREIDLGGHAHLGEIGRSADGPGQAFVRR